MTWPAAARVVAEAPAGLRGLLRRRLPDPALPVDRRGRHHQRGRPLGRPAVRRDDRRLPGRRRGAGHRRQPAPARVVPLRVHRRVPQSGAGQGRLPGARASGRPVPAPQRCRRPTSLDDQARSVISEVGPRSIRLASRLPDSERSRRRSGGSGDKGTAGRGNRPGAAKGASKGTPAKAEGGAAPAAARPGRRQGSGPGPKARPDERALRTARPRERRAPGRLGGPGGLPGRPGRDRPELRLHRGRRADPGPRRGDHVPRPGHARRRPGPARLHLPAGERRPGRRGHPHPRPRGPHRRPGLPAAGLPGRRLRLRAHPGPGPQPGRRGRHGRVGPSSSRCGTASAAGSARATWSSSR